MRLDPTEEIETPYIPLTWFEDTREMLYEAETKIDGTPMKDLVVVREDGSLVSLKPWTWPEFPWHKASEYTFQAAMSAGFSFTRDGHRYSCWRGMVE